MEENMSNYAPAFFVLDIPPSNKDELKNGAESKRYDCACGEPGRKIICILGSVQVPLCSRHVWALAQRLVEGLGR